MKKATFPLVFEIPELVCHVKQLAKTSDSMKFYLTLISRRIIPIQGMMFSSAKNPERMFKAELVLNLKNIKEDIDKLVQAINGGKIKWNKERYSKLD